MQHTPGPWRYEPESQTIRSIPSNHWLATMDSFDGAVSNEANARLIAAAPELLDALQNLQRELHSVLKLDAKKHYSLMIADAAANTAIAKAVQS